MKYQIILEAPVILDNQTFTNFIELVFNKIGLIGSLVQIDDMTINFRLIEARSLDGIKEEVWKLKESLKGNEVQYQNKIIDEVFDDLNDLFKIT